VLCTFCPSSPRLRGQGHYHLLVFCLANFQTHLTLLLDILCLVLHYVYFCFHCQH
jgi:hypothetical protein